MSMPMRELREFVRPLDDAELYARAEANQKTYRPKVQQDRSAWTMDMYADETINNQLAATRGLWLNSCPWLFT
tara:strand:- start:1172 stop:1390 length:219 start_codon:yes stop_codon:yes gene_type:complete